jgi:hypothetical protein
MHAAGDKGYRFQYHVVLYHNGKVGHTYENNNTQNLGDLCGSACCCLVQYHCVFWNAFAQITTPARQTEQTALCVSREKEDTMITGTPGTPRKRPFGITILTIFIILTVAFQLIQLVQAPFTHILTFGAIIAPVTVPLGLVIAWGLWTLKRWAFWLVVIFQALALLSSVLTLNSISIIISLAVLLYLLLDPNVRAAFRATAPPSQPLPPMPRQ